MPDCAFFTRRPILRLCLRQRQTFDGRWQSGFIAHRRIGHANPSAIHPPTSGSRIWLHALGGLGGLGLLAWITSHVGKRHISGIALETEDPSFEFPFKLTTAIDIESETGILKQAEHILSRYILEPFAIARRFFYLLLLFIPIVASSPLLLVGSPRADGERWGSIWWYGFVTRQMQSAGPTFVKLAQWAASRTDLFPQALCESMGRLHSSGTSHSFFHTRRVIERTFQRSFDEVFEEFERTPIGVGAIAQVYKAILKSDLVPPSHLGPKRRKGGHLPMPYPLPSAVPNASVAIKVLHPKATELIARDLTLMKFFARVVSILPGVQWLSLPEEVEVFGAMMNEQLDMRNEAANLAHFETNFETRKAAVTFPRPLSIWSTREILIEEYQHALPLKAFLSNGGGPFDQRIAQIGLDVFLNMLILDNFVHSDLHPGNILVRFYKPTTRLLVRAIWASLLNKPVPTEPTDSAEVDAVVNSLTPLIGNDTAWSEKLQELSDSGYQPELIMLDAGLVNKLNEVNRQNFLDLFAAIATFDGYKAGTLMIERCRTPQLAIDPQTFALKIQHLVLQVKRESFSLARIKISDILTDVLKSIRQHHVKMEADFVNTVLSVLLLEGIGRKLDPNLDLFQSSLPVLRKLGRQFSSPGKLSSMSASNLSAMVKFYLWAEARSLASAAFLDADNLVHYDLIAPNI